MTQVVTESLCDRAITAVAAILELTQALRSENDYGKATGFCAELDRIEDDAMAQLQRLRARAGALKRRIIEDRFAQDPDGNHDAHS